MAGHSHASNVKHKKNAADAKKAKIFTKICKDIYVCAKQFGGESPRLATLLEQGRKMCIPKENMERALERALNPNAADDMIDATYEAFALSGVALMIKTSSSNTNRIVGDIKLILRKFDGTLSPCEYMFEKIARVFADCTPEQALDLLNTDFLDIQAQEQGCMIECTTEAMHKVEQELAQACLRSEVCYVPFNKIELDAKRLESYHDLVEALEALDEVEDVWTNV